MTKLSSRLMGIAALIGLAVVVSGCKTVCRENRKAGLATITCQPLNVEVTGAHESARFKVKACGHHLTYQWYFNDTPLQDGRESKHIRGAQEDELTISDVSTNDVGFYRCEIDSLDCDGDPIRTTTRAAALGTSNGSRLMELAGPPTQPLPPPGAPAQNACKSTFCSCVFFRNGTSGYPPDLNTTKGLIQIKANGIPQSQLVYDVLVYDSSGPPVCATNVGDGLSKTFPALQGHTYRFTVYFKCGNPAVPAPISIALILRWQQ